MNFPFQERPPLLFTLPIMLDADSPEEGQSFLWVGFDGLYRIGYDGQSVRIHHDPVVPVKRQNVGKSISLLDYQLWRDVAKTVGPVELARYDALNSDPHYTRQAWDDKVSAIRLTEPSHYCRWKRLIAEVNEALANKVSKQPVAGKWFDMNSYFDALAPMGKTHVMRCLVGHATFDAQSAPGRGQDFYQEYAQAQKRRLQRSWDLGLSDRLAQIQSHHALVAHNDYVPSNAPLVQEFMTLGGRRFGKTMGHWTRVIDTAPFQPTVPAAQSRLKDYNLDHLLQRYLSHGYSRQDYECSPGFWLASTRDLTVSRGQEAR